ncbi:MAG: GNAT family N-acetyltransferase [Anaerolineae bacterium]|nr:GNAT family N-acetyltransferase [Anaerolineae bacterium]
MVDSTQDDRIVSAVLLIPQVWHYEDVPIPVGRVELVATHRDYRRKGLVRAQINAAHQRSADLGHLMQGITGIPHYYRRFGYTMGVNLGVGMTLPLFRIPDRPEGETSPYTIRDVAESDAELLYQLDQFRAQSAVLSLIRTPELWRYEISGRDPDEPLHMKLRIIENAAGQAVGYFAIRASIYENYIQCFSYVVGDQDSYLGPLLEMLRDCKAYNDHFYAEKPAENRPKVLHFDHSIPDTVETYLSYMLGRSATHPYAWYLRVPDLVPFIQQIAPVLERRLSRSHARNVSGTLKIAFFNLRGLEIRLERGQIVGVEERAFDIYEGDTAFPFESFLNLLFGHRSGLEIAQAFPEVYFNSFSAAVLDALFPKGRAWLIGLA